MAGRYKGIQSRARAMIERFGTPLSFKRNEEGTATNPWEQPTVSTTEYQGYGVIMEYQSHEIDGISVLKNDRKVLVPSEGLAIVPTATDILTIGSVDYAIANVAPLAPSNEPIIYTIQARNI